MTTAPKYPLMHAYLGEGDPMEIVDSPFGRMEREKAKAIATGSGLVELSKKIRNDAVSIAARQDARQAELDARADAINARELQHAVSVTNFVDFVGKASVLFDKLQRLRADQAEEPLATPPGTDPSEPPEPSLELEGDNASGTAPGDPSEPEPKEDQSEFPDPELPHPPEVQQLIAAGLDKGK